MARIAIVGAGIAGLTLANRLALHDNHRVTLFEKSQAVGGRIATKRAEPFHFDHGSQFFIARTDAFKTFIQPMIEQDIIACWNARFAEIHGNHIKRSILWADDYPHYVGTPSMNTIAQYLAQGAHIQRNTQVARLKQDHTQWVLFDNQDCHLGHFDWVISTIPSPQALALMGDWLTPDLPIHTTTMQACYSLMLGFEEPLELPFEAALVHDADISWISVNSSKPGRSTPYCLLIHATNRWADAHLADPLDDVKQYLIAEASRVCQLDMTQADHQAIHRWRYANHPKRKGPSHLILPQHNLALCGDWFIQGRIEAAFTSANALYHDFMSKGII